MCASRAGVYERFAPARSRRGPHLSLIYLLCIAVRKESADPGDDGILPEFPGIPQAEQ